MSHSTLHIAFHSQHSTLFIVFTFHTSHSTPFHSLHWYGNRGKMCKTLCFTWLHSGSLVLFFWNCLPICWRKNDKIAVSECRAPQIPMVYYFPACSISKLPFLGYPSGQRRSPDRLSTDPYSQRWKLQKPQIQNRQKPLRTLQKHRLRLNQPWFQTRSLRNWRSRELRVSILQGNFIGLGKILDLYLISTPWQIESSWPPWQEMFARIDVDKSNTITKEEVWLWAQWGLLSMAWGLLQDVARMIVMGYNIIGENKICSEQYDDGFPKLILTFSTDWKTRGHHIWKNSGDCWQSCWDELQESYKSAIAARITCSIAYQELSYLPSLLGIIFNP